MKFLFILPCFLALRGCQQAVSRQEYAQYLADPAHGLVQTRQVGLLTLTCAYRPAEVLQADDAAPDSAYAMNTYVALSFSLNGKPLEVGLAGQPSREAVLSYLNGEVYQDASLVQRADTLAASGSLYPRQYGTGAASTVLLVFNRRRAALAQGFRVVYRGAPLGGDTVSFPFSSAVLRALPALRTN